MDDLISRQEAIDRLSEVLSSEGEFEVAKQVIIEAPTLDEKEIIRKPMERILTRLEEEVILERMNKMEDRVGKRQTTGFCLGVNASIEIVKEEGGIE